MAKTTKRKRSKVIERSASELQREAMRAKLKRFDRQEAAIRQLSRTLMRRVREADASLDDLAEFIAQRRAAHAEPAPANLERELVGQR